jgi:hypothetical protein
MFDLPFTSAPNFGSTLKNLAGTAVTALANPVLSRLTSSGLLPGGMSRMPNMPGTSVRFINNAESGNSIDWKVRISVSPSSGIFYMAGGELLKPLTALGNGFHGVIFPYTPQISTSYVANYQQMRYTHSNYTHYAYENSEVQNLTITADFTAQNKQEALYVLACIYFFRAATKMFFGSGDHVGNPPPLVFLDGYGEHYFKNIPCLVSNFTHTMPPDVDYIETSGTEGGSPNVYGNEEYGVSSNTRIPTVSQMQIQLLPTYSKENIAQFNLNDFSQGKLIDRGFI